MQKGFPRVPMQTGGAIKSRIKWRDAMAQDRGPARSIEEIVEVRSMSHEQLSPTELDVLWRFLVGGGGSSAYVNALALFVDGMIDRADASRLFQQMWTAASEREEYNKGYWQLLRQQLFLRGLAL